MTIERKNKPLDIGYVGKDYRTVKKAAELFNFSTNVNMNQQGNIYIPDSYGNACIHRLFNNGELLKSLGRTWKKPRTI